MKKKAIIVDLDGTLCNCDHRIHLIRQKPKKWNDFHNGCSDDTPNKWCEDLIEGMSLNGYAILLLTGRPENVRGKTEFWLDWNMIVREKLFMKGAKDHRDDNIVKKEIYKKEIEPHYDVQFVVDDRTRVVKMWRELGLVCLQCQGEDY